MRTRCRSTLVALGCLTIALPRAEAQWQVGSFLGDTLRLGFLVQARAEWLDHGSPPSTAQNLFLRHVRLLLSGKLHHDLSFFLGTDSPNLGKAQLDGVKNAGEIGIYDFWVTYAPSVLAIVDVGLIGTPNSHNSIQSISTMLAPDFGPYSFLATAPTNSRSGRDYGAQARGYLLGQRVEYRAGVFQGARGANATRPFRYLARAVVDVFGVEKSVYYSGTSLGTRRSLALGASLDHQEHYQAWDVDLYIDQPLPNGDAVTVQGDLATYDGGVTFPVFARRRAMLLEAGYLLRRVAMSPFAQYARDDVRDLTVADQEQWLAGLAWWLNGHRFNVKVGYGQVTQRGARTSRLGQVTMQVVEF